MNLLKEILFNILIFWTGLSLIRFLCPKINTPLSLFSAFPIGVGGWSLFSALSITIGIPYNALTLVLYFGLCSLFLTHRTRTNLNSSFYKGTGVLTFIVILLTALLYNFHFCLFSGDSYYLHFAGFEMAHFGTLTQEVRLSNTLAYPLTLSFLQSAYCFVGLEYPATLLQLIALFLFAMPSFYLYERMRHQLFSTSFSLVLSIILYLFLFSIPMSLIQVNYFNGHCLYAYLIGLSGLAAFQYFQKPELDLLRASFICLLLSNTLRIEAPLATILFTGIFWIHPGVRHSDLKTNITLISLFIIFWHIFITLGSQTNVLSILSVQKSLIVIGLVLLGMLFIYLIPAKALQILQTYSHSIFLGLILLVICYNILYISPLPTIHNIRIFFTNMLFTGGWGTFWYFLLPLSLMKMVFYLKNIHRDTSPENIFFFGSICYICFSLALGGMGTSYKLKVLDSSNRMFFHILPLLTLWAITSLPLPKRNFIRGSES